MKPTLVSPLCHWAISVLLATTQPVNSQPDEIARQPLGGMTMANSDAGTFAYTHVAIDQALRAVAELPDDAQGATTL